MHAIALALLVGLYGVALAATAGATPAVDLARGHAAFLIPAALAAFLAAAA